MKDKTNFDMEGAIQAEVEVQFANIAAGYLYASPQYFEQAG